MKNKEKTKEQLLYELQKSSERIKELEKAEEILRNFMDSSTVGVWCFRLQKPVDIKLPVEEILKVCFESVCVECNDTYAKMMGATRDKILGMKLSEVMPDTEENRNYLFEFIKNDFRSSGGVSHEIGLDGQDKYFSNSMAATIRDGRLVEAWGIQTDITEIKTSQEKLDRMYSTLFAIREINQLIVREKDSDKLLKEACDIFTTIEGYNCTSIVLTDEVGNVIKYFSTPSQNNFLNIENGHLPEPLKKVLEKDGVILLRDYDAKLSSEETIVAIRLKYGEKVYGLMAFSALEKLANRKENQELFKEIAGDITFYLHEVELERERKQSEEKYQSLAESSDDPIYILDKNLNFLYANKKLQERYKKPLDEIIGQNYSKFHSPEGVKEFSKRVKEAFRTSKPVYYEHKSKRNGGFFYRTISPIIDPTTGEVEAVTVISKDITRLKLVEEKIREEEQYFESLFNNAPIAIITEDLNGRIVRANPGFKEIFGYSPEEVVGKNIDDVVVPEDKIAEAKEITRKVSKGIVTGIESIRKRKDGSLVHVSIGGAPIYVGKKKIGFLGTYQDITERKHAMDALERSEELLRGVFNASEEIIFTKDVDSVYTQANEAFSRIFNRPRDQIIGHTDKEIFSPEEAKLLREIDLEVINSGRNRTDEDRLIVNGKEVIFRTTKVPLRSRDGEIIGVCGFAEDITERKLAAKKLEETHNIYRDAIENIKGVPYRFNYEGSSYEFMGRNAEEVLGIPGNKMTFEKMKSLVKKIIVTDKAAPTDPYEYGKAFREGRVESYRADLLIETPKGEEKWLSDCSIPIRDEKTGKVISSLGILQDITYRKMMESQLELEREQLKSIFDSLDYPVYVSDPESYELLYVNKFLKNAFGKDPTGGKCYKELQGFDSPCEFCTNYIIKEKKGESYVWEYHNPILNRDYILTDRIIKWSNGKDVRLEAALDITDIKRLQESLEKSEKNFRNIFHLVPESLVTLDKNLDVMLSNRSFNKLVKEYSPILNMTEEELKEKIISAVKKHYGKRRRGIIEINRE